MYTESEFMDMSLSSRLDRLNVEIQKLKDWVALGCKDYKHLSQNTLFK